MSVQTLEKEESYQKFIQHYKSIVDVCKELVPLEKKVLKYENKLNEGRISPFEVQLLKKDMDRVLELYDKLEKTSKEIRELRKQLPPEQKENEVKAIVDTKAYLYIEGMRTHSRMMGSRREEERVMHAEIMEGLNFAENIISNHHSEIQEEIEKIKKELSARKLA
ncbi:MAG: hypothetical protein QXF56_04285 [Candidatus Micrarchaeia archaeon]